MPQEFDEILASLTENQREAVLHMDGPLLVLAGPGSGKTRVITCRIAHLIHQGVPASQILAITFTNKAAGEMKQRIDAMLPGSRVWISTFHALGVRLLRQYADRLGLDRNFTIYDQADRVRVVKSALHAGCHSRGHQQGQESIAAARPVRETGDRFFQASRGAGLPGLREEDARPERARLRRPSALARVGAQE
jgi:superfamily I DNA/RNA helicase